MTGLWVGPGVCVLHVDRQTDLPAVFHSPQWRTPPPFCTSKSSVIFIWFHRLFQALSPSTVNTHACVTFFTGWGLFPVSPSGSLWAPTFQTVVICIYFSFEPRDLLSFLLFSPSCHLTPVHPERSSPQGLFWIYQTWVAKRWPVTLAFSFFTWPITGRALVTYTAAS